jgi:hypothetical protein
MGIQSGKLDVWIELVAGSFLLEAAGVSSFPVGGIRCFECREFVALAITALQGRLGPLRVRRRGILCCAFVGG